MKLVLWAGRIAVRKGGGFEPGGLSAGEAGRMDSQARVGGGYQGSLGNDDSLHGLLDFPAGDALRDRGGVLVADLMERKRG